MRLLPSVVIAVALSAASVVAAQQRPIAVVGAGGRFETQLDPKTRVDGFTAAQTAAYRARVDQLVAQFRAMPTVNTPPAPICHRLMSWIELMPNLGLHSGRVEVLRPINFNGGKCNAMTGGGVQISINRPTALIENRYIALHGVENTSDRWYFLPIRRVAGGRMLLEGNVIAFVRPGALPFKPVTIERFLKEKVRQNGPQSDHVGQLAALPASAKGLSACMDDQGRMVGRGDCPLSRTVLEIDKGYFEKTRPSDIQMLVIETPNGRSSESAADEAARMAMWRAMDLDALQAMVR